MIDAIARIRRRIYRDRISINIVILRGSLSNLCAYGTNAAIAMVNSAASPALPDLYGI
jgi:hypothetical protein